MKRQLDLLETYAPEAPPELLNSAREQAAPRAGWNKPTTHRRLPLLIGALAGALILSLTPPGRAATGWVADVVGLGQEPSLPQLKVVENSATAIVSGTLDDGTRYELVFKKIKGVGAKTACFQIDWVDVTKIGGGGACTHSAHTGRGNEFALETSGVSFPPKTNRGPAVFFGIADSDRIVEVAARSEGVDGNEPLDVSLIEVRGEPLAAVGGRFPVKVFVAELSADLVEDVRDGKRRVTAVARDDNGEEVGEAVARFNGIPRPIAAQEDLVFVSSVPKELQQLARVDATAPSEEERDSLVGPEWQGALLTDAVDRFESEPRILEINDGSRPALETSPRRPDDLPALLLQTGLLRTEDGQLAYYVFGRSVGSKLPSYVGLYAVDDLEQVYFAEIE